MLQTTNTWNVEICTEDGRRVLPVSHMPAMLVSHHDFSSHSEHGWRVLRAMLGVSPVLPVVKYVLGLIIQ